MQLDHRLDDTIRIMAQDTAQRIINKIPGRDIQALANSQMRKFWDILKMEQSSHTALLLAQHQQQKATKEVNTRQDEVAREEKRKNPRELDKKRAKLEEAQTRKIFWQEVANIANDTSFVEKLKQSISDIALFSEKEKLISLQILFAEALYSELLFLKAQTENTNHRRGR